MKPRTCKRCPTLLTSRKRIAWGEKYVTRPTRKLQVMVVAEAPGHEENIYGRPLIGASGQEGRHNLDINGISGRGVWLDNICKCKPEGNRDPNPDEIRRCTEAHLIPKILELEPEYIISMGAVSTRWFLGDDYTNMELLHGIPRTISKYGHIFTLIPTYHPAMGLHSPESMLNFQLDMRTAGDVIRGKLAPYPPTDKFAGKENYVELESANAVKSVLAGRDVVTVDTETVDEGATGWCLSFSAAPGEAYVVKSTSYYALEALNSTLSNSRVLTVFHNALYDLPVLAQMGIYPVRWTDTMVMAYLLQSEPQGLKPLASRHCGMEMVAYSDVVKEATYHKALEYLIEVASRDWPNPDPVLEWKDGEPHVRQPQNIKKKVLRILAGVAGEGDAPYEKWKAVKDGKEIVESALGRLIPGELCDVDPDVAIFYAARDADATIRIFPILQKRIESLGLEDTLKRDMRMIPMVVDMMKAGMPIIPEKFAELSKYFQQQMDLYQRKIQHIAGKHFDGKRINPGSHPQMATLVYDKLKLHKKGGEFKAKRSKGKGKSTAEEVLKRYVDIDPIVTDILTWRGYQKLRGTYSEAIPKLADADDRVRCDMRITRAATGRLSAAKPNLMAVPVRSDEGRMIREGFVAPEGRVLVAGDYSQVEMRVLANASLDENMLKIFWAGEDLHAQTASWMFNLPVDKLDSKKHRYPAKRIGFGIVYMITAQGLQRELAVNGLDWSVRDCENQMENWFGIFKGVREFMKKNGESAKRYGYVRDMYGRIRFIPGIRSTNKWIRLEAERQAGNAPIQMGAQGLMKEAMGRLVPVYQELQEIGYINPLLQIHDDIVWEMDEFMVPIAMPRIKEVMENAAPDDFLVPTPVDFKLGKVWGSMEDYG